MNPLTKNEMKTTATAAPIAPKKGSSEAPNIPLPETVGATATLDATKSFLSSPKYGYDYVVATTQESINSTMHKYMAGIDSPEVSMYYIMDYDGNPQEISRTDLLKQTNNIDPFDVPDTATKDSPEVKALSNAYFMYAFKAKIGLPPGYAPLTHGGPTLPNVVTLGRDTKSVEYKLLCSEFQVVSASYGPRGIMAWMNQSQPSGDAWIFTSLVDLRLTEDSNYGNLPPDVQKQIKNLGPDAFSIQQLLFDMDNATLATVPTLSGVTQGTDLANTLNKVFVGAYFTKLNENGEPVLNYTIKEKNTSTSTLSLVDLNFHTQPYITQDANKPTATELKANTLCYLCASDKDTKVLGQEFGWNWVDVAQASQFDGVISINRDTFGKYLESQLLSYARNNSFSSEVHVDPVKGIAHYSWNLKAGQDPTITLSETTATENKSTVLTFSYTSTDYDSAGLDGALGSMRLTPTYTMTVEFIGKTIIIKQWLKVYTYIRSLQNHAEGDIVDIALTDTYTMAIDQNAGITFNLVSTKVDNSETPSTSWIGSTFTEVNTLVDDCKTWTTDLINTKLVDIPLDTMKKFIFPGGNTFAYKDAFFSDNQDLITHITYTDPS